MILSIYYFGKAKCRIYLFTILGGQLVNRTCVTFIDQMIIVNIRFLASNCFSEGKLGN